PPSGPGKLRAVVVPGGTPVLPPPTGAQLEKATGTLDFMVAVDPYLNETTRHAHVLLPPTTALEREHYDIVFHLLAVRNTAKWSPPLFPPAPDARHDWEIFSELTSRLRGGGLRRPLAALGPRVLPPRHRVDLRLRTGPYGWRSPHRLSVRKLERHPHGIDLGPLTPALPGLLLTEDRRIHLAPPPLVQDLDRAERGLMGPTSVEPSDTLWLIGRRQLRSNNSWMHNSL